MALGRGQPDQPGRTTGGAEPRPAAAHAGGSGAPAQGGVARPGLGRAGLAHHDHRRPPRGTLRLRWQHVDLANGVLTLRRSIAQDGNATEEKDTKTHQRRHVTLDPESVAVLTEHWERCRARASALGVGLTRESYVFSLAPDGSTHLVPSTVTQRYKRMAGRLGIDTHLHNLRHYSATELIAAGVDGPAHPPPRATGPAAGPGRTRANRPPEPPELVAVGRWSPGSCRRLPVSGWRDAQPLRTDSR